MNGGETAQRFRHYISNGAGFSGDIDFFSKWGVAPQPLHRVMHIAFLLLSLKVSSFTNHVSYKVES